MQDDEDTQPFDRRELDELIKKSVPPPDLASGGVVVLDGDGEID